MLSSLGHNNKLYDPNLMKIKNEVLFISEEYLSIASPIIKLSDKVRDFLGDFYFLVEKNPLLNE